MNFRRAKSRFARKLTREARAVHYFHQVDDPYSHLAVQKLDSLRAAYNLPFKPHLVSKPGLEYQGSAEHFNNWALRDAVSVAEGYDVSFPERPHSKHHPDSEAVHIANNVLASHLDQPGFAKAAIATGEALWAAMPLKRTDDAESGRRAVQEGDALREKLGHYLGGMFYFDGEWFWGIDRLRLLEQRLVDERFGHRTGQLCVPEPASVDTTDHDASHVQLEYFPSLRSPYTAIGHLRVLELLARSGVSLKLRPVMPMLMRGVPAPRSKQLYIITDAGREARARGIPFGRIVDPFGEPVRRAFALFPSAMSLGKGLEFVTAYLSAAWTEGVDITTDAGLRRVATNAGIDWHELQQAARGTDWEAVLDDNLKEMLSAGLWGVPSFRITGGADDAAFACWGQDRLWRVENEIARRAQRIAGGEKNAGKK